MPNVWIQSEGPILKIEFSRPEKGNSYDKKMILEISQALTSLGKNQRIKGVLLSGRGKHLCTGADLRWMAEAGRLSRQKNLAEARILVRFYELLFRCEVPVLLKAQGKICGGGVGLVAAVDLVACERETNFRLTETRFGLLPGIITPFVIEKIGRSRFLDLALTGSPLSAKEAERAGLVQFCGSAKQVDLRIQAWTSALERMSPDLVRAIKKSAQRLNLRGRNELAALGALTAKARANPDAQEKIRLFLEKTKKPHIAMKR